MKLNELVERIGIDRSVLYEFTLRYVDVQKIQAKMNQSNLDGKPSIRLNYNEQSPIRLSDGSGLGKIVVSDKVVGRFAVAFEQNNLTKKNHVVSTLELMVSDGGNNLQNLNTAEYQARISDVFEYLAQEYGVKADYGSIRIKRLELNATFFLEETYEKYRLPILFIMRNMPTKKYGTYRNNDAVKYATWHESNVAKNKDSLETVAIQNSTRIFKIYNKKKHLLDIGEISEAEATAEPRDIMRVEYTIKDKRLLNSFFGDDLVSSLTDEKIKEFFQKNFNADVVQPFAQWAANNHKELIEMVQRHRENEQKWPGYFLRECRQYNESHHLPILFDIDDMRSVFKALEPKGSRNDGKKFKKFKQKATYEADLTGNTRRIKEIMSKIMSL